MPVPVVVGLAPIADHAAVPQGRMKVRDVSMALPQGEITRRRTPAPTPLPGERDL